MCSRYETILQATFGFFFACAAYMVLNCGYWMNTDRIRKIDKFFKFYVFICVTSVGTGVVGKLIWSDVVGLRHPMPFYGMILAYIAILVTFVGLWYSFPINWRKNSEIWGRFKFFCLAILTNLFITLIYTAYTKVFTIWPQ